MQLLKPPWISHDGEPSSGRPPAHGWLEAAGTAGTGIGKKKKKIENLCYLISLGPRGEGGGLRACRVEGAGRQGVCR